MSNHKKHPKDDPILTPQDTGNGNPPPKKPPENLDAPSDPIVTTQDTGNGNPPPTKPPGQRTTTVVVEPGVSKNVIHDNTLVDDVK